MDDMAITAAQYRADMDGNNASVKATIDGVELFVPLDPNNRHYAAILRAVASGTLTIDPAE